MYYLDLLFNLVFTGIYRLGEREDYAGYAYRPARSDGAWAFPYRAHSHLLYRRRVYRYDFADQPRTFNRTFYGERILRQVGALDLEITTVRIRRNYTSFDVCGANRLLNYKKFPRL